MARVQAIFNTRIVDFKVEPTTIKVGDSVTVSGRLEWYCPPIMCPPFGGWKPYESVDVEIYVNGNKVKKVNTIANGYFSTQLTFDRAGKYEILAHYPGSWKDDECWSDKIIVTVLTEQEYQKYQKQQEMKWIIYGLIGIGIVGAIAIAVELYREQQMEEMMLLEALKS